jgi:hypothetical protein
LLYRGKLSEGVGNSALQAYCYGLRLFEHRSSNRNSVERLDTLIEQMRKNMKSDQRHFYLGNQLLFDIFDMANAQDWRQFSSIRLARAVFATTPLIDFLKQVEGTKGSVISVRRDDGIGAAILRKAMAIGREPKTRDILVSVDLDEFYNALSSFSSSIVISAGREKPYGTITLPLESMGPLVDPDLRLVRQLVAATGESGVLRFVQAVGDDRTKRLE